SLSRTLNFISKSLYFFLVHRKVLKPGSFSVRPTMAPSLTDQYSGMPSQPSRFLPLKKPDGGSAASPDAVKSRATAHPIVHVPRIGVPPRWENDTVQPDGAGRLLSWRGRAGFASR